jgi:amidase
MPSNRFDDILLAPSRAQLKALRSGALSAEQLLGLALERLDALNPALNAVVAQDREAALAAARASDTRYATGTPRPLDGLPVTIKDAFEVRGFAATCGSPRLADHRPDADAAAVARLREAGAVIVGKTNVPEFSADWQTDNALFGRTNNPWDVALSPGGSSGGAAVAVATGMSSFELGSDVAGSIRWPSQATGIFGHKSTQGLVPMRGHIPPSPWFDDEPDLVVAGPLARSAVDLRLVLEVLTGRPLPRVRPPRGVWRLGVVTQIDGLRTSRDAVSAVERAAEALARDGADVDHVAGGLPFEEIWQVYLAQLCRMHHASRPGRERRQWAARAGGFAADDGSASAWLARSAAMTDTELFATLDARPRWHAALAPVFARYDALLMPPAPTAALPHDARGYEVRPFEVDGELRPIFEITGWIAPATVLHLPSTTAPVLRSAAGLPCGVQILGPLGGDATTIAIAEALESATGGFVAPPIVRSLASTVSADGSTETA